MIFDETGAGGAPEGGALSDLGSGLGGGMLGGIPIPSITGGSAESGAQGGIAENSGFSTGNFSASGSGLDLKTLVVLALIAGAGVLLWQRMRK